MKTEGQNVDRLTCDGKLLLCCDVSGLFIMPKLFVMLDDTLVVLASFL
jgi:hypothetical protein